MATLKVFMVHLRRPGRNDYRSDPFYEKGSFGCTKCHSKNLLHPNHAKDLKGSRLAFVQGGELGSRLVLLTPPITVTEYGACCEAKWSPAEMPFKYLSAPILASDDDESEFPLIERFARSTDWGKEKPESGLSSLFRSRVRELDEKMAKEVITVYGKRRRMAQDADIASSYDETMCPVPKSIDSNREETYERLVAKLRRGKQSRCGSPRRRSSACRKRSTN